MKRIAFYLLLFIFIRPLTASSQEDMRLKELLAGKTRLDDIMQVVKAHYKDTETIRQFGPDQVRRYLKKWQRYEWYMSSRLGANGEFVNINQKMIEATGIQQRRANTDNGQN